MEPDTHTLSDSSNKYESVETSSNYREIKQEKLVSLTDIRKRVESMRIATSKPGVFSGIQLSGSGFDYTGNADAARCKDCALEISGWTSNMKPFEIHSKQKPDCSFVRSIIASVSPNLSSSISSSTTTSIRNASLLNEQEHPSKRLKIETVDLGLLSITFLETDLLQQVRIRTFSHWSRRTIPSAAQMIEAGFFSCNVGDRVICIHCNLICQEWTIDIDDPYQVHKTLSPNCIYVKAKLIETSAFPIINPDESSTNGGVNNHQNTSNTACFSQFEGIAWSTAYNSIYAEIGKRYASFDTWSNENSPSVDDLVQAGFYYTGEKTDVACFYCNGLLQNWGPNDNPMIEHSRWFPNCAYARQLCGAELYRKIQEPERAQQKCAGIRGSRGVSNFENMLNINMFIPSRKLSEMVAARLDLPVSQSLLDKNFTLAIVKKCWENQLRLKKSDVVSECDLYVACLILQKQIEHIDGKKENVVIPSIKMKQIREENQQRIHEQLVSNIVNHNQSANSTSPILCVLCLTEERRIGCIPCGHLVTCVACSRLLRLCPACGGKFEAFVRIFI